MSLFLQILGSWQASSKCPPPKSPEQNDRVDRFYDLSQASGTPERLHILYHCISMLMFLCSVSYPLETLSLYSIQHSWGLHPLDWVYLLTHFLDTIRLRRYHKILKCILLRIFWILMPYSVKNFWSLNKTCVWVPFCLLLNAFLLHGLCRLCYIEHVVKSISGTF